MPHEYEPFKVKPIGYGELLRLRVIRQEVDRISGGEMSATSPFRVGQWVKERRSEFKGRVVQIRNTTVTVQGEGLTMAPYDFDEKELVPL